MENFERCLKFQKELAEAKVKLINRYSKRVDAKPTKRTSKITILENVLGIAGRSLHISEIIEIAARDFQVDLERHSVVSIMTKRIKASRTFVR
ncbi:MAG: hypothetical protein GY866_42200 [Proteobacteria bacterium]|nr:hypothetical protein [Pseudomonadota bacterium]